MSDWVQGTIVGKHGWAEGLFSMQIEADIGEFAAGQYTKVALDIGDERIVRPYSLVNAPGQQPLEIYFNEVPEGPLTPRLSDLNRGDRVWVAAKAGGIFTLETVAPAKTLWLLATGTALGVYLSILRTPAPWEGFERIVLVHGVRTVPELAYGETIVGIGERYGERFDFVPVVSREQHPVAMGGRITNLITDGSLEARVGATISRQDSHVMLCGNSEMIKDAKLILEGRGLARHKRNAPGQYSAEQYH